jgi:glycerol uptake facilitator-like aquaporin
MTEYPIMKSAILEGIGSFALVLFGTITEKFPDDPLKADQAIQQYALVIFFINMVMMWIAVKISGSQFNPTLSLGLMLVGKLSMTNFLFNVLFQVIGGAVGYLLLMAITDVSFVYTHYTNTFVFVMVIEFIVAFFLCLVYFFTFVDKSASRAIYGFAVPATYAFLILCLAKYHYSTFNFVMLAIPTIFKLSFDMHLLWVGIGSASGCLVASLLYRFFFEHDTEKHHAHAFMANEDPDFRF